METLQDTNISMTIGTELCPCWRWPGRDEAIRDVGSCLPQGRLLPATAPVSLVDFGVRLSTCRLSSAPNPVINFKIHYGALTEATPCHSFYIFLTYFHKNNKFTVSAGVQARV